MTLGSWENAATRACAVILAPVQWEFHSDAKGEGAFFSTLCDYSPAVGSWLTCISDVLEDKSIGKNVVDATGAVNKLCEHIRHFTSEDILQTYKNASSFMEDLSDLASANTTRRTSPIRVDSSRALKNSVGWLYFLGNFDTSNLGARLLLYYIVLVVLISVFAQSSILTNVMKKNGKFKRAFNWAKGALCIPTLYGKHAQSMNDDSLFFRCLLPTREEASVIGGYFILHTLALVWGYRIDYDNTLFSSVKIQLFRYVADRTGIISMAEMALVMALSTRNSLLEWTCGWKFNTCMMLHKWIGRLCVLDAVVHSVAYVALVRFEGTADRETKQNFWIWGVRATHGGILLVMASIASVRARVYELFLVGHVFLAAIFLYYTWAHLSTFGYKGWVYISALIWLTEHLFRTWRVLRFSASGVIARCEIISSPVSSSTSVDHGTTLLRLRIPRPANLTMKPGHYVFLYFLLPREPWKWWQSHPFTVVDEQNAVGDEGELTVVIQPKHGITAALMKHAKSSSQIRLLVEGPYGPTSSEDYDLLLAGGSGVPGPLSHALHQNRGGNLVLVSRHSTLLDAWRSQLLALQGTKINLIVYFTGNEGLEDYGATDSILTKLSSFATIRKGRPDVNLLLQEVIVGHKEQVSVICCGPPRLVDTARDQLARFMTTHQSWKVDYTEEYQIW